MSFRIFCCGAPPMPPVTVDTRNKARASGSPIEKSHNTLESQQLQLGPRNCPADANENEDASHSAFVLEPSHSLFTSHEGGQTTVLTEGQRGSAASTRFSSFNLTGPRAEHSDLRASSSRVTLEPHGSDTSAVVLNVDLGQFALSTIQSAGSGLLQLDVYEERATIQSLPDHLALEVAPGTEHTSRREFESQPVPFFNQPSAVSSAGLFLPLSALLGQSYASVHNTHNTHNTHLSNQSMEAGPSHAPLIRHRSPGLSSQAMLPAQLNIQRHIQTMRTGSSSISNAVLPSNDTAVNLSIPLAAETSFAESQLSMCSTADSVSAMLRVYTHAELEAEYGKARDPMVALVLAPPDLSIAAGASMASGTVSPSLQAHNSSGDIALDPFGSMGRHSTYTSAIGNVANGGASYCGPEDFGRSSTRSSVSSVMLRRHPGQGLRLGASMGAPLQTIHSGRYDRISGISASCSNPRMTEGSSTEAHQRLSNNSPRPSPVPGHEAIPSYHHSLSSTPSTAGQQPQAPQLPSQQELHMLLPQQPGSTIGSSSDHSSVVQTGEQHSGRMNRLSVVSVMAPTTEGAVASEREQDLDVGFVNDALKRKFNVLDKDGVEFMDKLMVMVDSDPAMWVVLQEAMSNFLQGDAAAVSHLVPRQHKETGHMTFTSLKVQPIGFMNEAGAACAALLLTFGRERTSSAAGAQALVRDHHLLAKVPGMITLTTFTGEVLHQNARSVSFHGSLVQAPPSAHLGEMMTDDALVPELLKNTLGTKAAAPRRKGLGDKDHWLQLLFMLEPAKLTAMLESVKADKKGNAVVEVPELRFGMEVAQPQRCAGPRTGATNKIVSSGEENDLAKVLLNSVSDVGSDDMMASNLSNVLMGLRNTMDASTIEAAFSRFSNQPATNRTAPSNSMIRSRLGHVSSSNLFSLDANVAGVAGASSSSSFPNSSNDAKSFSFVAPGDVHTSSLHAPTTTRLQSQPHIHRSKSSAMLDTMRLMNIVEEQSSATTLQGHLEDQLPRFTGIGEPKDDLVDTLLDLVEFPDTHSPRGSLELSTGHLRRSYTTVAPTPRHASSSQLLSRTVAILRATAVNDTKTSVAKPPPQNKELKNTEGDSTNKKTTTIYLDIHAHPFFDPSTQQKVLMLVAKDVTEGIKIDQRLAALRKYQTDWLLHLYPRHVIEAAFGKTTRNNSNSNVALTSAEALVATSEMATRTFGPSVGNLTAIASSQGEVTVMFASVANFNDVVDGVPPKEILRFLNALFRIFDSLVEQHMVYKVETKSDCYVVAGGLMDTDEEGFHVVQEPGGGSEGAKRVLQFAQAIVTASQTIPMPGGQNVELKVGLHTGEVVSGVVGTKMPWYCLFGDTMNTASRMMSSCPPSSVRVSEDSMLMLPSELQAVLARQSPLDVKGKGWMTTYLWQISHPNACKQPEDHLE